MHPLRPDAVHRVAFGDLVAPGPRGRVDVRALVPLESVQPGDEQVLAARSPDLDPLAGIPSVRSVVASTTVRASRPLPQITELLLLSRTPVPDALTLRNLPNLTSLWVAWAPAGRRLDTEALPETLSELGVHRAVLAGLADLKRLSRLRHLVLEGCLPKDSLEPLAGMAQLVRLRANARGGWQSLGVLTGLEEVSAIQPRLTNLRAWRSWSRLRALTLTGSGVGSLAGMEAFTALERLRLVMMGIDDLSPLAGLPRLAEIELTGLAHVRDLGPLRTLPSLRRLTLEDSDVGTAVADLRRARPDVEVAWRGGEKPAPGVQAGPVVLHPPNERIPSWWLREDLTGLLQVPTNADAEARLRTALASEDPSLLARLRFDTEADAVVVESDREDDLRAVARVIERLAG